MSGWWFKVTEQISLAWELTEGQSRCMGQKADLPGSVQIFGLLSCSQLLERVLC